MWSIENLVVGKGSMFTYLQHNGSHSGVRPEYTTCRVRMPMQTPFTSVDAKDMDITLDLPPVQLARLPHTLVIATSLCQRRQTLQPPCYACMVLTSWGKTDGAPEAAGDSYSSMWIKIISLWVFYLMYYKALHLAYLKQTGQA